MFQTLQGRKVYVVDLPNPIFIRRPITFNLTEPETAPYAAALEDALRQGLVPCAGKYAIEVTGDQYLFFAVTDEDGDPITFEVPKMVIP